MRATFTISLLLALILAVTSSPARAGEGASAADRVAILQAEMSRRSVDLVPYLQPGANPRLRRLAIRALGRIGDDGNAPGILRDLLATPGEDQHLLLWAAGIAMSKELAEPLTERITKHLEAGEFDLAAQAARSLGWTGADGVDKTLVHCVDHEHPAVIAGGLVGLGRARVGARAALMMASGHVGHPAAEVRAAADYACWLMAGRHRGEESKKDEAWDGDEAIAARFLGHLKDPDPERRMGGIRVLGSLMPAVCTPDGAFGAIYKLIDDPDPRVVQDAIWRIFSRRAGNHTTAALTKALAHPDAKVRTVAAEALGKQGLAQGVEALSARWEVEPDARVREVLVIELVRHGKDEMAAKLMEREDRPEDPVVRQHTAAQLLLVSQRPEALQELMTWADPGASQRAGLHAATWMTVLSGLEGKEHEKLDEWLLGFLAGGYAIDKPDRHFVMASAVSLAGTNKRHGLAGTMLEMLGRTYAPLPHDEISQNVLHVDVRKALLEALGALAGDEACPAEVGRKIRAVIQRHWEKDPSPWVRLAARETGRALKMDDVPEIDDVGQPNTWRGIPQAPLSDEDEPRWIDAAGVVQLADFIANSPLRVVFETNLGSFAVTLDAKASPVHAVSLVTAVNNGVYTDSRFHRVVPNFVIQGGDPHGHGAGNGGWEIPDEINTNPYGRGALGMPKSVKDDGGCQIFVMHSSYHPLDERYTCYGHVRSGMDVVDKIRVGDRILHARVVIGGESR